MSASRSNWKFTIGLLVCLLAVGAFLFTRNHGDPAVKDVKPPQVTHPRRETAPEPKTETPAAAGGEASLQETPIEEAEPPEEPLKPDPTVQKLEELNAAGNLNGIQSELKSIAAAGDIPKVFDLLKTWCQEGKPELVRTCLDFSKTSDPDLHMTLKVESIANPSEEIRNAAMDDIEKSSGIRFENVRHARMWWGAQHKH